MLKSTLISAVLVLILVTVVAARIKRRDRCGMPLKGGKTINPVEPNRNYTKGEFAEFNCTEGYKVKGQLDNDITTAYHECTGRKGWRRWEKPAPKCTRIVECGPPPNGTNVEPVPSTPLRYPEFYAYTCNKWHDSSDDMVVFCLQNGTLSMSSGPNCTLSPPGCEAPDEGTRTQAVSGGPWGAGELFVYECLVSHTSPGCESMIRVCQSNGTWSGTAPTCTEEEEET